MQSYDNSQQSLCTISNDYLPGSVYAANANCVQSSFSYGNADEPLGKQRQQKAATETISTDDLFVPAAYINEMKIYGARAFRPNWSFHNNEL